MAEIINVSASDGSSAFLYHWNGQSWTSIGKLEVQFLYLITH